MKILYIAHNHPPKGAPLENMGGMQRVSMQLVAEFKKREDVEVVTLVQEVPWKGIEWRTALFLIRLSMQLPGIVAKEKPDVILFSSMVTASLAGLTRNRISVPMVTINHGHDVKLRVGVYQKYLPKVFRALNGVISVSSATRDECIKRGMDPEKGIALPNGFDVEDFQINFSKSEARERLMSLLGLDFGDKKILVTVGRQVKRKGHAWFIKTVWPLIKENVVYLAIGDGPEHDKLKELRESVNNKEHIILAGRQPDEVLSMAYAAADLFIMPNVPVEGDMEGFGIVLLEANLANTPAIASDLEGIKDVIVNGKNGYKVADNNEVKFASRIDTTLQNGLEDLSISAKEFVFENFTWNKVADRYISYLKRVSEN